MEILNQDMMMMVICFTCGERLIEYSFLSAILAKYTKLDEYFTLLQAAWRERTEERKESS